MLQYEKISVSEGIDVNIKSFTKECIIIGTLKVLDLSLNRMFPINVTM